MKNKNIPGTCLNYADEKHAFNAFKSMIELGNGITLSQICNITGVEDFAVQNWVKRGYVAKPVNKKYFTKHFARILLINSLKDALKIEEIGEILTYVNGDAEDETDDILSEEDLYNIFSAIIYDLEDLKDIEKVVNENTPKNKKLRLAMKTMVYAYISCKLKARAYEDYKILKGGQE